jgi:DUF1009 family protein
MKTIGLIIGAGHISRAIAEDARSRGYRIVAAALEHLAEAAIEDHVDVLEWFNAGKVGAVIKYFKKHRVREALVAGKVPKTLLYKGGIKPDLRALKLLFTVKDRNDDSIIGAIAGEFEGEGIRFLDMRDFCSGLLTPEGTLTRNGPSREEWKDIEFGFRMAKDVGKLGIGQTVVVRDLAVMAVEAIEGTDEAIRRGGELADIGATVVKVSRPGQDMRFDLPVVGLETMDAMIEGGIRVLAVEAGKSILLDREEFIRRAEEARISVVGYRG